MNDASREIELLLFDAVLQIGDEPTRRAFLDQTCAGHPEMRGRLEELLEAHGQSDAYFSGVTEACAAAAEPSRTANASGQIERTVMVMAASSLSVGAITARPHRTRVGGTAERVRVRAVRRAAGRAHLEGEGLREFVVIEPRHQPGDDAE